MQQILTVWRAMWDSGQSGELDIHGSVRSRTKEDWAVDVGVQDLYHIAGLLFKIHVIFVIVLNFLVPHHILYLSSLFKY